MAFSDYKTIAQVQQQFLVKYQEENFILPQRVAVSPQFQAELEFNRINLDIFSSEAARTEAIIFPILREVYKKYHQQVALWIQKAISYDENLTGTPDYMVSTRSALGKTVLGFPLMIVVEAKKNDFEQGWAQCLAELIAAQKLNAAPHRVVHGVVTDGKSWEFGRLRGDEFSRNVEVYTLNHLAELLGCLEFLFDKASQEG